MLRRSPHCGSRHSQWDKKPIVYSPQTQGHSDLRLFGVDSRQLEVASEVGVRPDDPVQFNDQLVIGDRLSKDEADRLFDRGLISARADSAKRLSQFVHASPDRCTAINGRSSLDTGVSHLRLNHIERHVPGNRARAEGVTQPMG